MILFCGISGMRVWAGADPDHEATWLTRDYCAGQSSLNYAEYESRILTCLAAASPIAFLTMVALYS